MVSKTNIEITDDTWARLNGLKRPGDTFDDVLVRVLDDRDELQDDVERLESQYDQLDRRVEQLIRGAVEQLEIEGIGADVGARRLVVLDMARVLHHRDAATRDELLDAVDLRGLAGYASETSLWEHTARPGLLQLGELGVPIASPGQGGRTWRWREANGGENDAH